MPSYVTSVMSIGVIKRRYIDIKLILTKVNDDVSIRYIIGDSGKDVTNSPMEVKKCSGQKI